MTISMCNGHQYVAACVAMAGNVGVSAMASGPRGGISMLSWPLDNMAYLA